MTYKSPQCDEERVALWQVMIILRRIVSGLYIISLHCTPLFSFWYPVVSSRDTIVVETKELMGIMSFCGLRIYPEKCERDNVFAREK